ncbi:hypothetical protein LROSRS0_0970 [Furfurilactobacillus rossiae]|nr:hypothetical protein LROSRS0_0970 [Furfurilactobacillus rossiae]
MENMDFYVDLLVSYWVVLSVSVRKFISDLVLLVLGYTLMPN